MLKLGFSQGLGRPYKTFSWFIFAEKMRQTILLKFYYVKIYVQHAVEAKVLLPCGVARHCHCIMLKEPRLIFLRLIESYLRLPLYFWHRDLYIYLGILGLLHGWLCQYIIMQLQKCTIRRHIWITKDCSFNCWWSVNMTIANGFIVVWQETRVSGIRIDRICEIAYYILYRPLV